MAFSGDGQVLASANSDGVQLWSAQELKPLRTPAQPQRGIATTLAWSSESRLGETLCFGTQLGFLVIWREDTSEGFKEVFSRKIGSGAEIVCLATDTTSPLTKIAAGMRDRGITVWTIDDQNNVENIFSVRLNTTMAATLAFHPSEHSLLVFGLEDRKVHSLDTADGQVIRSFEASGSEMGCAAISFRRGQFVVDNVLDGFDLYDFGTGKFVRSLRTGRAKKKWPKQIAFAEDSRVVVGGSDHGVIYVFERKTGEVLDELRHASQGLAQAVSVCDVGGLSMIATGSGVGLGQDNICLWTYAGGRGRRRMQTENSWESWILRILLLLGGLLIMSAYFNAQHIVKWHNVQSTSGGRAEGAASVSWVEEVLSLVLSYSKLQVQEKNEILDNVSHVERRRTIITETFENDDDDDEDDDEDVIDLL
ncbi:WD40 repeat-like protein [Pluteus cervinus]|uniref:WD40 repeat-like protein n=1 Tax=Pluteus cervinus TaxID=181527 RepID=A0ACD3A1W7_9AGAR|nr:WD40 repeat-like protein [Pluteus cervinus]